jgi:branched-chain amino acid transport system permease protein
VSGLLFVYYHKYIHPVSLSLSNSAEGLLAVIAGGSGTLAGPLVGAAIVMLLKNYVSGLQSSAGTCCSASSSCSSWIFMPEGVVPGVKRLWRRFTSKT